MLKAKEQKGYVRKDMQNVGTEVTEVKDDEEDRPPGVDDSVDDAMDTQEDQVKTPEPKKAAPVSNIVSQTDTGE